MCRWSVFVSGHGSNLGALLEIRDRYPIELVVSSKADAFAVTRANKAGVPVKIVDDEINWDELYESLQAKEVSHIFLAGFMKIVPSNFLKKWDKPIINLHPSLLPSYPGLRSIERAYKDKAPIGVTIHQVTEKVDSGDILLQQEVFSAEEAQKHSLKSVTEEVHRIEHQLVCKAVEMLCKT